MDTHVNLEDKRVEKRKYGRDYLNAHNFPSWVKIVGHVFFILLTALALVAAVLACIFIRTPVLGPSMQPTINQDWTSSNQLQDTVLINRLQKGERGDIIVVDRSDMNESHYVIKRLIATAGDYVTIVPILNQANYPTGEYKILLIKKGEKTPTVVDDGFTNMADTYAKFNNLKKSSDFTFKKIGEYSYLEIGEDKVFYLGDNRNVSQDCSLYGPVDTSSIIGKVVLIIDHNQSVFKECFKFFVNKVF